MTELELTQTAYPAASWFGRVGESRWAALPVVLTGTFMIVLDFFIVNVAIPSMQADLRASTGATEWLSLAMDSRSLRP